MRHLFIFLAIFFTAPLAAQKAYVYTQNKQGIATHKEVVSFKIEEDVAVFHTSGNTYLIFDLVGTSSSGEPLWVDRSNQKFVTYQLQDDGVAVFWITDKKAIYITP